MLQEGKWSTDALLSKSNKTNNKNWNKAITDAQEWVKRKQMKSNARTSTRRKTLRKSNKIDIEHSINSKYQYIPSDITNELL